MKKQTAPDTLPGGVPHVIRARNLRMLLRNEDAFDELPRVLVVFGSQD
jgi:hypothetical protein